jgi:Sulfotransferase family
LCLLCQSTPTDGANSVRKTQQIFSVFFGRVVRKVPKNCGDADDGTRKMIVRCTSRGIDHHAGRVIGNAGNALVVRSEEQQNTKPNHNNNKSNDNHHPIIIIMAAAVLRDNFHKLLAIACVIFVVNISQLWMTTNGVLSSASLPSSSSSSTSSSRTLENLFLRTSSGGGPPQQQLQEQQLLQEPPPPAMEEEEEGELLAAPPPPLPRYRTLPARDGKVRVLRGDHIYYRDHDISWDSSPIVIESHKLIFFTIPKVGCTVWKQLFRRMMGHADWSSQDDQRGLPHNPATNGLVYLSDLDLDRANHIMKSPDWTRAIMVRDPKQRLLSAFLDKSVRNFHQHIIDRCCPLDQSCVPDAQTMPGFLRLCRRCADDHWRPQNDRVDDKFWPYMDVVLHVEQAANDAEQLLRRINAYDEYGASGWGQTGTSTIFQRGDGGVHSNFVEWQVWKWYTPAIEEQVVQFYQQDYDHPLFQFDPTTCLTCINDSDTNIDTDHGGGTTITTDQTMEKKDRGGAGGPNGSTTATAIATQTKKKT